MVKALPHGRHRVILDVVYNHTAEGDRPRPDALLPRASTTTPITASTTANPWRYVDYTGCETP